MAGVEFYGSGTLNLGSTITASVLTDNADNNLFDDVTDVETSAGHTDYRCIYIKNAGSTNYDLIRVWINDDAANVTFKIGLGAAGVDGSEPEISSETAVPSSVSFSAWDGYTNALIVSAVDVSSVVPLWIERTIAAGALSVLGATATVTVNGQLQTLPSNAILDRDDTAIVDRSGAYIVSR